MRCYRHRQDNSPCPRHDFIKDYARSLETLINVNHGWMRYVRVSVTWATRWANEAARDLISAAITSRSKSA
ncbi:hypothetical protein PUN28_000718 [Cardiocondyla obscurior]|uniref:RNase H type-1 domain-containing protein n=1 Tax=Cardiocondyla obscurior TaxID=286306 RepID=A0AAW2H0X3_9HYME